MAIEVRTALVTGAGRGIGRGIAVDLASRGYAVVVNDKDPCADDVAREIEALGGQAVPAIADVSTATGVRSALEIGVQAFGPLGVLVNNAYAPVGGGAVGPFLQMTGEGWLEFMRQNLGMLFLCTHAVATHMVEHRVPGRIVNISSNGAVRPHRGMIAYDAAKGAVDSFTRAVAIDLAPAGIMVNAIRPGDIAVDEWHQASLQQQAQRRESVPVGREGAPSDVAGVVAFLVSADAAYVTGQVIDVDGGLFVQGRPPQLDLAADPRPPGPRRGDP